MRKIILGAGVMVLCSGTLSAAVERELLLLMDIPIVVTASKTEQPITEAPATIDVITAEDIENFGYRTLADVLRAVPGIDNASIVYTQYFSPRGLNGRRSNSSVLCLIDGHPYNEVTQGSIDPCWVSLSNVKRIEIIKGPGSALYGANAFAGVINIITKSGADVSGATVTAGLGNFSIAKQELIAGGSYRGTDMLFTGWRYATAASGGHAINTNDDRRDMKYYGKIKKGNVTFSADHYQTDIGIPGTGVRSSATTRGQARQGYATLDYAWPASETCNVTVLTHVLSTHQKADDPRLSVMGNTISLEADSLRVGAEAQLNYRATPRHTIVGGIEWKREDNNAEKIGGGKTIVTKASYLQDEWKAGDRFIITAGARFDIPSAYPSVISPRVNLTYKHSDRTVFKTSYGEAFRAPNFFELYADLRLFGLIHFVGNPGLVPEKIATTEAGMFHRLSDTARLTVNLFYTRTRDFLFLESRQAPGGPFGSFLRMQYANATSAEILGGETSLACRFSRAFETVASYSYQNSKDLGSGLELNLAPRHKINLLCSIRLLDDVHIHTSSTYYSGKIEMWSADGVPEQIDAHSITNAKIIFRLSDRLKASAAVYNLFDARYEEMATVFVGGRSYITELSYAF